jgi:ribulose kinase
MNFYLGIDFGTFRARAIALKIQPIELQALK